VSEFNKKDFQSIPVTRFELLDGGTDSRFTLVKIWIAHTGKNLNKSNFSKELLTSMIPSLTGVPIVGFVEADNANKVDFKGHEERYIVSVDGVEIEYLGRAYGFIPENNDAKFELKTVDGVEREYLTANGLIWNKFSKAKEILDRDVFKAQSMELERESLEGNYSKTNDEYVITGAKFEALCMLGSNKLPAMVGGLIEKFQFTAIKFELQEMIEEMKLELKKGGRVLDITKFEELVANYTYVSSEFAEDIKSKLDSYESEEQLVEVLKSENDTQYALIQEQEKEVEPEVNNEAVEETVVEEVPVKSEYEILEEAYKSAQETIATFEAEKASHEEAVKNYELQLEELNSLREYKASIETQIKKDYVASVENLDAEEKSVLVEKIDTYTLSDLQDEVAKLVGKKMLKFSFEAEKPLIDTVKVHTDEKTTAKSYDYLFEKKEQKQS
jgi:hypothetical protein